MPVATLRINEKKPIVSYKGNYGPKTLFVIAEQNWPQAAGEPCCPLDVIITVRTSYDNVYTEDQFPLPNLGWSGTVLADKIDVFAYYTPEQALATPYTEYLIAASIVPGDVPQIVSSFVHLYPLQRVLLPFLYPATGSIAIPRFSKEFRVQASSFGSFTIRSHPNSFNYWGETYDFEEVSDWTTLPPFAWHFWATVRSMVESGGRQNFTIEFR
jgi:hypothetical protein